jgi:predicted O-linked N-acetylglucosamine transferase (SPINDLY family)
LPECYWAYRPVDAGRTAEVAPPPAFRNGFVTFGSFNSFRKVNPAVVAAWARVLRDVPDSRLVIIVLGGEGNTHVKTLFTSHGVAPERLRLLPRQPPADYFSLHNEVDVTLDPFPYNGGITSLNSLWMGVPFVTLAGDRAVGRAGLSLLTNVGLPDLVARDADDYVRRTVQLARDTPRLADLRATLRPRLRQSPLMDEPRFTRAFEQLLRAAWERWRSRA